MVAGLIWKGEIGFCEKAKKKGVLRFLLWAGGGGSIAVDIPRDHVLRVESGEMTVENDVNLAWKKKKTPGARKPKQSIMKRVKKRYKDRIQKEKGLKKKT